MRTRGQYYRQNNIRSAKQLSRLDYKVQFELFLSQACEKIMLKYVRYA